MASTRPPGTYSPSARAGRRGGGSGGVASMVRRAGSDASVGSSAASIRRRRRPNTAFRLRGCFDSTMRPRARAPSMLWTSLSGRADGLTARRCGSTVRRQPSGEGVHLSKAVTAGPWRLLRHPADSPRGDSAVAASLTLTVAALRETSRQRVSAPRIRRASGIQEDAAWCGSWIPRGINSTNFRRRADERAGSILGTLFERGLDPDKRAQLGAHYTDRDEIMLLVEPVVIRPLLAEWNAEKTEIAAELERAEAARSRPARTKRLNEAERRYWALLNRLRGFTVLDPACGSGNFLYLALQALKDPARAPCPWRHPFTFTDVHPLTRRALTRRVVFGHDQAARGGRRTAALDVLSHVPGSGDHRVPLARRDA